MNKKAKADVKGVVMALMVFSVMVFGIIFMAQAFMTDYGYTATSNLTGLSTLSQSDLENGYDSYQTSYNDDINGSVDLGWYATLKKKASDTIEDSMFGKALSVADNVKNSFKAIGLYAASLGDLLALPPFIVNFIIAALTVGIIFIIIYFYRGWQK